MTAWEDSLGLTGDGKITKGELVFIPGRLLVDTVSATVGGSVNAGSALVVGRQAERKYLVAGRAGATIDHQPAAGTKVATGTVLFWSNGFPVIAIEGDATATPVLARDLSDGVSDGVDVKLFEQALDTLGFNADSTMVVDDHFDAATATATAAWLASLGITVDPATLVVPAGSFTVVPSGLSIGTASDSGWHSVGRRQRRSVVDRSVASRSRPPPRSVTTRSRWVRRSTSSSPTERCNPARSSTSATSPPTRQARLATHRPSTSRSPSTTSRRPSTRSSRFP